jgi:hypothetical protein
MRGQDFQVRHPHIACMSRVQKPAQSLRDDSHTWRVVDDLAHDCPVTPAELDAVEAFLMPLVQALLAHDSDIQPGKAGPGPALLATPTHKRRNELLPKEI